MENRIGGVVPRSTLGVQRGRSLVKLLSTVAVATLSFGTLPSVHAGPILYNAATAVSGVADVLGAGTVYSMQVDAKNLGGGLAQTLNGVSFAAAKTENTNALDVYDGFFGGDTGNAGLNNLLTTGAFITGVNSGNGFPPLRLTLNDLVIGWDYRIQLLFADVRGYSEQMTVDGLVEVPIGSPHSLVGTFIADTATQVITIQRSLNAGGGQSQLNAYALFTVPEPSTMLLLGMALAGLGISRRKKA